MNLERKLWAIALVIMSLIVIGWMPAVEADAITYPDNIEVISGTQTGSFPLAIERDDDYVLRVTNSSSYQYPSEYWVEEGDQGMSGMFPADIMLDDADYIQVADWGQNAPLDEPHTIMHWNLTNVPTGDVYQVQHKGYYVTDDPYCSASFYRLYVWDGGTWNLRADMSTKFGSVNEAWTYYNLTGAEYQSGSPKTYVDALCLIDEQDTIIRDYTNVMEILVYREVDVAFEWVNLPMGRQRLDFQAKATGSITAQIYNGTASDWEDLATIASSWTNYSNEIIFDWYNSSNPSLRFYGNTTSGTISIEIDYVRVIDIYLEKIEDLEDDLEALERELERLRKSLGDSLPDVVVNETAFPTVPSGYNYLDYDVGSTKPYRSTTYTVRANDSGSSMAFYLPRPGTSDESRCLKDHFYFAGSFTTIWINDTSGAVIFTSGDQVGFYNAETCQNLTIETTGGDIRADRHVRVRLIYFFEWGEDKLRGVFSHTSSTTNAIAYDMQIVRIYWGFPYEESGSQIDPDPIVVDIKSIRVTDMNHNHLLTPGRHYIAYASGVVLELRWLNRSGMRVFEIEFAREPEPGSRDARYIIHDTDVKFSSIYEDSPYEVRFMHTVEGTADFEGTVVVQWDLTGTYTGKKLNVSVVRIQRSDESGFLQYWYDSISNELYITDQIVASGDSIEYVIYLDWYEGESLEELLVGLPWLLIAAMVMVAVIGVALILTEEGKGKYGKYQKYLGYVCIAFDAIVLLFLLAGGGF